MPRLVAPLGLLLLVACTSPKEAPRPAGPLKIGSYGPLSGPAASWGAMLRGMDAYFDFVNAQGGVHGRALDFDYRDDAYNPARTPTIVRDLVEREGVFAIVGGLGTANGKAVATYLEERNVPFITPASGDPWFTDPPKRNVYTVYPRYDTEGAIIARYITSQLGLRRVGVLYQDDDFGTAGLRGVKAGLQGTEGSLVVSVACRSSDTDLTGQVSRIVEAKPEILVLYTAPRAAVLAVKQLVLREGRPELFTSFVLSDPSVFELAGPGIWEGTYTAAVRKLPDSDDPSVAQYREVLRAYGEGLPVGNFTLSGFAFAQPFVEALHRAGPDPTPEKLYAAFESMQGYAGGGPHWRGSGLNPPLTFSSEQHRGHDRVFIARAEGGRWTRRTDWLTLSETTNTATTAAPRR